MALFTPASPPTAAPADRTYLLERVGEAAVVQVYADAFRDLPLREKTLIWHLAQAAIAGRDIFYDQRYAHNLEMRDVLEAIVSTPGAPAPRTRSAHADAVDEATRAEIERYTKLFWINTGPYNNLTARKFVLAIAPEEFSRAARAAERAGASFPLRAGETLDALLDRLRPMFFDAAFEPMVTCKTPPVTARKARPSRERSGESKPDRAWQYGAEPHVREDILQASANNLYVGVTMDDLAGFEERSALNSRLVKRDGR